VGAEGMVRKKSRQCCPGTNKKHPKVVFAVTHCAFSSGQYGAKLLGLLVQSLR